MNDFSKERNVSFQRNLKFLEISDLLKHNELAKITEAQKKLDEDFRVYKSRKNFNNFIAFEIKFLELLRNKPIDSKWRSVMNDTIFSIAVRINGLFKEGAQYFNEDIEYWLSYANFVTEYAFLESENTKKVFGDYENILADATKNIPNSVNLWLTRMRHYMKSKNEDMFEKVFREGIVALKENSLELWILRIQHFMLVKDTITYIKDKVKSIYEEAINTQPDCVANPLKIRYYEWTAIQSGQQAATNVYIEMRDKYMNNPLELHNKMFELELLKIEPSEDFLQNILEHSCDKFGATEISVWVKLMKFEKQRNRDVRVIYEKALKKLDPTRLSSLDTQYAIIKQEDPLSIVL